MKKLTKASLLFTLLLGCIILSTFKTNASGDVAINSTNFPDSALRDCVKMFDSDNNGKLSQIEINNVYYMDVSQRNITSLKGIEYFTELTEFHCCQNKLTSLDVSKNVKLKTLDCSENEITYLNVSKNTNLETLTAYSNKFTSLDVSSLTNLKELNTGGFYCQTVNVQYCKKLESFAAGAAITSIDLTQNTELKHLTIGGTISSLDLSKCPNLTYIDLGITENLEKLIIHKDLVMVKNYDGVNCYINCPSSVNIMRDGQVYMNEWVNGRWYNSAGQQDYAGTLSWKHDSTGWWVEDTSGWYPVNTWQKIDGIWYYFKSDGYMAAGEYYNGYWFNNDGSWNSKYQITWKSNSTGWWIEDISGWWPSNTWLKIDGSWYYFDGSGYMVTNQYIGGYWIGADGTCK